jgi:hypothetical protein
MGRFFSHADFPFKYYDVIPQDNFIIYRLKRSSCRERPAGKSSLTKSATAIVMWIKQMVRETPYIDTANYGNVENTVVKYRKKYVLLPDAKIRRTTSRPSLPAKDIAQ